MCGITALLGEDSSEIILKSLYQLQNRGYDSAGISTIKNNKYVVTKKASTKDMDALKLLKDNISIHSGSKNYIAHTRWATHGKKNDCNSHPHISNCGTFSLVHNGIIENYLELKNFLKDNKYEFKSETDTEVICNLIEYFYLSEIENKTVTNSNIFMEKSIKLACEKMQGTWALAIINKDNPNNIYITRNGSPLLLGMNDNMLICTSEVCGFCNNLNNYIKLENNDIITIENGIIKRDIDTNLIKINKNFDSYSCAPYKHWTLKEICEQPQSILRAFNNGARIYNNSIKLGGLEYIIPHLKYIDNIILLASGTSMNACMVGKSYFYENCNFNTIHNYDAAEFIEEYIPKNDKNLIIYCSQSGETRDLFKNIEICRKYNCINLGVINVVDSLIATEVDCGVYLNAGREVAVASTKSFTSTLIVLSLISLFFSERRNIKNLNKIRILDSLRSVSNEVEKMLQNNNFKNECTFIKNTILKSMEKNKNNSIFILGKGKMYPIALEAALKIKEITYIHAEGYSGGALKHGPFALLDDNSIVFLLIDETTKISMLNTYEEIKSRGASCFIITEIEEINIGINNFIHENIERENKENKTYLLKTPKNIYYQEIITIVAIQYLAYIMAIEKNINPDKPRNLAKVVTVE